MQDWYEQRLSEMEDRMQELEKIVGSLTVQLHKSEEVVSILSHAVQAMQRQLDSVSDDMEDVIADINSLFDTVRELTEDEEASDAEEELDEDDAEDEDDYDEDDYDEDEDEDYDESESDAPQNIEVHYEAPPENAEAAEEPPEEEDKPAEESKSEKPKKLSLKKLFKKS